MKCPVCNVEARITNTYTKVTGDNNPEEETRIFTVMEVRCRNKNCSNYDKVVGEVTHEQSFVKSDE